MAIGAFDNWVHDQQELAMRHKYEDYLAELEPDVRAMTFDEFCSDFLDKADPTP